MLSRALQQFEEFIAYVESLSSKVDQAAWSNPIAPGKWTLKELISHLWNWDVYSVEKMIPFMQDGAQLPPFVDLDAYNNTAIEKAKRFPDPEALIHQFAATRREMIQKLEEIYDPSIRFTIGNEEGQLSIDSYVDIFVHHDEHHKRQIEALCN